MTAFTVPFIPDAGYLAFLKKHANRITAVYFSLFEGAVLDSRVRFSSLQSDTLGRLLAALPIERRYCLMNIRMLAPDRYRDRDFFNHLKNTLEALMAHKAITGIVFCDYYFLTALSDHLKTLAPHLEAVPGINCMIDSPEKAEANLEAIAGTRFRRPSKLIMDRSLNRSPGSLKRIGNALKRDYPDMKIEVLANEGCLYQCPFKPAHDAHIALANSGLVRENTWELNRENGCARYLSNHPERLLKSPFIRPEDVKRYTGIADSVKLCGRTLGPAFLLKTLEAYFAGEWDGNLLELMDASHWMADHYHISNTLLGDNFFKSLTTCPKDCKTCETCTDIFSQSAEKKKPEFKRYRN